MRNMRGQKVYWAVEDCCAVGNCALMDHLMVFLVDELGWFYSAGVLYFWRGWTEIARHVPGCHLTPRLPFDSRNEGSERVE